MKPIGWLPCIALVGAVAVTGFAAPVQAQRAAMVSQGKEMAAFFDGPRCAEKVDLLIKGRDIQYFEADRPIAAGLIHGVSLLIRGQCPTLQQISATGKVQDRIVYTGLAEAANDWTIVELGVSKSSGALSGGRKAGSHKGEKQKFQSLGGFVPFPDLLAQAGNNSYLCTRYDSTSSTCAAVSDMSAVSPSGGKLIATSLIKAEGDPTVNFTDATQVRDGFLCINPKKSNVEVKGGKLTPAARSTFEDSFRERAADKGGELCVGYVNEGGQLMAEYFDGEDYSVSERSSVSLFANPPKLRIDE